MRRSLVSSEALECQHSCLGDAHVWLHFSSLASCGSGTCVFFFLQKTMQAFKDLKTMFHARNNVLLALFIPQKLELGKRIRLHRGCAIWNSCLWECMLLWLVFFLNEAGADPIFWSFLVRCSSYYPSFGCMTNKYALSA